MISRCRWMEGFISLSVNRFGGDHHKGRNHSVVVSTPVVLNPVFSSVESSSAATPHRRLPVSLLTDCLPQVVRSVGSARNVSRHESAASDAAEEGRHSGYRELEMI